MSKKARRPATRLYAAYGSNLNVDQMRRRCPKAVPVGATTMPGWALVFRSIADIRPQNGLAVPLGIWRITAECEAALDAYEGVASGLYDKRTVNFDDGTTGLIYMMRSKGIMPPWPSYFESIRQGYDDFGIDPAPLYAALEHAKRRRYDTPAMLARHKRRGEREAKARAEAQMPAGQLLLGIEPTAA